MQEEDTLKEISSALGEFIYKAYQVLMNLESLSSLLSSWQFWSYAGTFAAGAVIAAVLIGQRLNRYLTDPVVIEDALRATREASESLEQIERKTYDDIQRYREEENEWKARMWANPLSRMQDEAQQRVASIKATRQRLETRVILTLHELNFTLDNVRSSLEKEKQ